MATQKLAEQVSADLDDFDLDVSIVETGDAVNALLCSTDNGCGTRPHNGC